MASVEKFTQKSVVNHLRHIERTINNPSNEDINSELSYQNYKLSPDRGMTDYDWYIKRKSELYCYARDDVKTMAGWVVTASKDLSSQLHDNFFKETYDFLENRYGYQNVISAIVHNDESGSPHLHFYFIPAVIDLKHDGEKICANDVLNRKELRNFHPDLQRYLHEHGVDAKVMTGITAQCGGNKTVSHMKYEREHKIEIERNFRF